jgi:hypothetical protein
MQARRMAMWAALVALGTLVGCGGGDDEADGGGDGSDTTAADGSTPDATGAPDDTDGAPTTSELPPPDESTFEGQGRVVNLYVDGEGATQEIDVWAQRTFTNGPVLLAEGLGLGEASDYFSSPTGHSIIFTPAGSGPDGEELGGMFSPSDGQQITAVYSWEETGPFVPNDYERDPAASTPPPEAPAEPGQGTVVLRAYPLSPHEESLTAAGLGASFFVGDGSPTCVHQPIEDEGFAASILGGTQPVILELPAGTAGLTFHDWLKSSEQCDNEPQLELDVEVPDGEVTVVYLYTPDGESIELVQLPVP